jgi:hypothetical protein
MIDYVVKAAMQTAAGGLASRSRQFSRRGWQSEPKAFEGRGRPATWTLKRTRLPGDNENALAAVMGR